MRSALSTEGAPGVPRWLDVVALGALLAACTANELEPSPNGGGAPVDGSPGSVPGVGPVVADASIGDGGIRDAPIRDGAVDDASLVDGGGGAIPVADGGDTAPLLSVTCGAIVEGSSTVVVNGATRTFLVQLPSDTSRMALLFLWHGWRQPSADFASAVVYDVPKGEWVRFDPDAFPMPLMIVTPVDTGLLPPAGLDWDISNGEKDLPFFDGMLECIEREFAIDMSRIYSFGFSAGAVFSNLLTAHYPRLFAATISESGAWFNDRAEWSDVLVGGAGGLLPLVRWDWPAFDPADGGNVLLTHGGPGDFASVISLESANRKALAFLHDSGRTVMECAHTFGHTLDPDLTQSMYYQYLWAHQLGAAPLAEMVPGFPTQDAPVGATTCRLHP